MIDIKALNNEEFLNAYKENLRNRGDDPGKVSQILSLNEERKKLIVQVEEYKAQRNKVSQEVAKLKRENADASDLIQSMQNVGNEVKNQEALLEKTNSELNYLLSILPNKCHISTPVGKSEDDNVEIKSWGTAESKNFQPKDHVDLGEALGIFDFEAAAKITGSRFVVLRRFGAQLERALINFMLDVQTEHGYEEVLPPFIVNDNSLFGTSQFPKFKEDVFQLENTNYYLIPTAEVPVTNYYAKKILNEEDLPIAFTAYTPCFRSEAGSYGKDTKGLIRQHQFNKVELVRFAHPNESYEQHELLTSHAEKVLELLELPYRRMALCTGDIGFGASKCFDLEVWLPGQNKFREISSCSNFEDFQARRAEIKFKPKGGGKPQFVHTLNGSGLAVGRTLVAILENYQNEDGSIDVPKVLQKYLNGLHRIQN